MLEVVLRKNLVGGNSISDYARATRRALMMRTASVRSVYMTASKRRALEMPNGIDRSSLWLNDVSHDSTQWIAEDGRRLLERYFVLGEICRSLSRIPFEVQRQPSFYLRLEGWRAALLCPTERRRNHSWQPISLPRRAA